MNKLTKIVEPITSAQKKIITQIIHDVADCDSVQGTLDVLSRKGAERLIGTKFDVYLRKLVSDKITQLGLVDEFANEEVESKFGYFSGYNKPDDLNIQCNRLRELFPGLGLVNQDLQMQIEKGDIKLPKHAEGWLAIPNWKKYQNVSGFTYSIVVQKVLDLIEKRRLGKFFNYRKDLIDDEHLRQLARTEEFFDGIIEAQGDPDILIIPAQFGIRHRGRSVRRARVIMEDTVGEFGLGVFSIGIMLLTHSIRLNNLDDLWISCAGDEFSLNGDGKFLQSPSFWFLVGKIELDTRVIKNVDNRFGSVSGFTLQKYYK